MERKPAVSRRLLFLATARPKFSSSEATRLTTLLLGHTDRTAAAAGGLGVLTADAETPVVTETAVGADLLEALEIVAELGGDAVGEDLAVLAVDDVTLSVEEPRGDLVLGGVLDDGDDTLELFGGELTGALIQVDCGWRFVSLLVSSLDVSNFLYIPSAKIAVLVCGFCWRRKQGKEQGFLVDVPSAFLHTMLE